MFGIFKSRLNCFSFFCTHNVSLSSEILSLLFWVLFKQMAGRRDAVPTEPVAAIRFQTSTGSTPPTLMLTECGRGWLHVSYGSALEIGRIPSEC